MIQRKMNTIVSSRFLFIVSIVLFTLSSVHSVLAGDVAPPTVISLNQAVHFIGVDGTDVIIQGGTYEVAGTKTALQLTRKSGGPPISIQAQLTTFPEEVDSPIAMAIPISEEGVYIGLVLQGAQGLEAMGFLQRDPHA